MRLTERADPACSRLRLRVLSTGAWLLTRHCARRRLGACSPVYDGGMSRRAQKCAGSSASGGAADRRRAESELRAAGRLLAAGEAPAAAQRLRAIATRGVLPPGREADVRYLLGRACRPRHYRLQRQRFVLAGLRCRRTRLTRLSECQRANVGNMSAAGRHFARFRRARTRWKVTVARQNTALCRGKSWWRGTELNCRHHDFQS